MGLSIESKDYEIDQNVGFTIIEAHEIDDIGMSGIIGKVGVLSRTLLLIFPLFDIDGEIALSHV